MKKNKISLHLNLLLLMMLFHYWSSAQICFSENAINYSSRSTVNNMKDIAAGLINNDSFPDIAIARYDKIYLRFGDGTGATTAGVQLAFSGNVERLELADMDNDGYEDIVALEPYNTLHILYNNGSGVFGDSVFTTSSTFNGFGKLLLDDVNGDGFNDAIVLSGGNGNVYTFLSSGVRQYSSGSFIVPFTAVFAAIGNFDAGNVPDIVFIDGIHYLPYYGNGNGFTPGTNVTKLSQMETIGIADMNNDGISDIIYTMAQSVAVDYYNGSGTISSIDTIDFGASEINYHYVSADDMIIFDTNNDDYPEVILPSEWNYSVGIVNNVGGTLSFTQYAATMGCLAADLADFDLDGWQDIVTISGNIADYFSVFKNESGGIFKGDVYLNANFYHGLQGSTLVEGDVDNDGFIDLITHGGNNLNILLNNGAGSFAVSGTFPVAGTTVSAGSPVIADDFTGDGNIDAILTDGTQQLVMMTGDGNGNFAAPVVISASGLSFPHIVIKGHFNNDNYLDIAYSRNSDIAVMLNNGTGGFSISGTIPVGSYTYGMTANDFNGDNVDDIAYVPSQTGGALYLNNGLGVFAFSASYISCAAGQLNSIASGDLNNDGNMDIAFTNFDCGYPHRVLIYHGNGTGLLTAAGSIGVYDSPYHLCLSDINFDGKLDVVTNSITGLITVAIKTGSSFQTNVLASGEVSQVVIAADLNNDSKPDLAFNNFYSVDVGVALNSMISIYPSSQIAACTGDSVLLYITDTVPGFEWSTGETNDSIYVVNSGVYFVSVTSPGFGNCFASTKATVTFSNPSPVVFDTTNNPNNTCINQPVNLQAIPSGGLFSGPGISGSTFDPSSLNPNQSYTLSYDYMNALGCNTHAEFNIFVDACIGLNELPDLCIKISPNPADEELVIDQELLNSYTKCEMYTPFGEFVLAQEMNNRTEYLNTAALAPGIYYLRFINASKEYPPVTRRICVVHY